MPAERHTGIIERLGDKQAAQVSMARRKRVVIQPEFLKEPQKQEEGFCCCWESCEQRGEYPAPRHRRFPAKYHLEAEIFTGERPVTEAERYWFCLDHVRRYNEAWDFFQNMDEKQIESFQRDAVIGHRPTWDKPRQPSAEKWKRRTRQVFDFTSQYTQNSQSRYTKVHHAKEEESLPKPEREALAVMDLEWGISRQEIKKRYRELAKQYHPDINRHKHKAEEKLKQINHAYNTLMGSKFFSS